MKGCLLVVWPVVNEMKVIRKWDMKNLCNVNFKVLCVRRDFCFFFCNKMNKERMTKRTNEK